MFKVTNAVKPCAFLQRLRANTEFADVILLVGPQEQKVLAHAVILAESCEYYRNALSERWNSKSLSNDNRQSSKRRNRIIIKHPDADLETVNAILAYLYTGAAEIPYSLLMKVALFADQLLLVDLVVGILACLADGGLVPENAIEVYQYISALSSSVDVIKMKCDALMAGMHKITEMLECGRSYLKEIDSGVVSELMAFCKFTPEQRWRVLVGWVKSRQDIMNLSVEAGIPKFGFDLSDASADIESLLGKVGIFKMTAEQYVTQITPYYEILPVSIKIYLETHFNVNPTWGAESPKCAEPWKSKILTQQQFQQLMEKLNFSGAKLSSKTITKLHSASETEFSTTEMINPIAPEETVTIVHKKCANAQ
ncbi:hypothetical protein HK100_005730 [Physocladia obscura]|uniref:BTB domain-containing protein n=1 Tax=Physocladia obscura TaxID=109957 RepID=A0AAD5XD24_9FUNG|nr:hypothetical protein HK100_005730 [Physocladia obscura]